MTKDFTPYDLAYELKQIGFDEGIPTFYSYPENKLSYTMDGHNQVSVRRNSQFGQAVSAPTFSQAFRWFKQNHKLKFHIREDIWNAWCYVHILMRDEYENVGDYSTYEEAELECLRKLIKIVKQKQ
jgi:hypothetical protein